MAAAQILFGGVWVRGTDGKGERRSGARDSGSLFSFRRRGVRGVSRDRFEPSNVVGITQEEMRLRSLDVGPEIDGDNDRAIAALRAEIKRQDHKHGRFQGTRLGRSRLALACLRDEVDEAELAWRGERKADEWTDTRAEVLQVAAVALRALRDAFDD